MSDYIYFTPYKYLLKRVLTQRYAPRSPNLQGSVPLVPDPGFSKRKFPRERFQGLSREFLSGIVKMNEVANLRKSQTESS